MNSKEKIMLLKNTIYQLYSIEGRNKTYISKLLGIDLLDLKSALKEWDLTPAQKKHFKPSEVKFYQRNKQRIDKLMAENLSNEEIAKTLKVNQYLIDNYVEYLKSLKSRPKYKNKNDIKEILYQDKFRFKTISAFARFLKIPNGKVREMLAEPEKNNLKVIYKKKQL